MARIEMNPLKGLAPLQKVHHSWPIPSDYLSNASPAFLDGVMHDYVRITGACGFGMLYGVNETSVRTCAAICDAVAPARAKAKLPPPSLTVNYSPWWSHRFPPDDPTVVGPPEEAEITFYTSQLSALRKLVDSLGATLGAVLLDSERFHMDTAAKRANATWQLALDRKHDLIYNATIAAFPQARIEMYDRGAVTKWDYQAEYVVNDAYTLRERGPGYSVALYTLPEIFAMRGRFAQTVANAKAHNQSGALIGGISPWIALGAGYKRNANASHPLSFDFTWDFDRVYSWQFGREVNNPWYGLRPDNYAPWNASKVVLFFPSIFDIRSPAAGPGNKSTVAMQHFVSYVRGANGLDGVAP